MRGFNFRGALVVFLLLSSSALMAQSTYTQTRHPVVLVHGMLGFDRLFGVLDYFYRVPEELRAGGARVYVANVSSANSSEIRGEQLIRELDTLKALYGHQKFNLLGHSHGGPTIRYVASVRPDLVASVTSVGAPHTGSRVADGVDVLAPPGSAQNILVANFVNALSNFIEFLSGDRDPSNSLAALKSLSSRGAAAFNARHPQGLPAASNRCGNGAAVVNGIRYFSMGGTRVLTSAFDASDGLLGVSQLFFGFEQNDGLVGQCSSNMGTVLRNDYPWNHLDQANQVLALRSLFAPSPTTVYRAHANRLKSLGL